jgi:putative intracellular protease/amidase
MKDSSSTQQSQGKPKALIVISSAKTLPLSEPSGHPGIPTGFFLVEMAQVLKEFENDYEFTFATPDGKVPQLDINSMSLAMHAIEKTASAAIPLGMQQRRRSFDADSFRRRHSELAARREQEIQLLERHMGRVPVSELLPNSEPEVAEFRPELIRRLSKLPEGTYHSLQRLVERHRDPADAFTFADFDFIHAPGGHAPMVDFRDNPWLGETLHLARENQVTISLICHAPLAVTSTWQRIDAQGSAFTVKDNPFLAATISVVPKVGELIAMRFGYPHVPGKKTRTAFYVDEAIKEAGFTVTSPLNISAATLAYEPSVRLLTGNGPQAIDKQAAKLREILDGAKQRATRRVTGTRSVLPAAHPFG